ncbi:hypothetical protein AAHE18_16G114200 [Arachis hypogaea]
MQAEPLIARVQSIGFNILQKLRASQQCLPDDLGYDMTSIIKEAINEQLEDEGPSSEILANIAEILDLRSNQDVLIEAVALERLKENAEQTENIAEAEYIDRMHERIIILKQAQSSIPDSVPADFCCPLSLELMTDPVIVSSWQTYERGSELSSRTGLILGSWFVQRLSQTLVHSNLIPNYTVKALIVNWCETNNVTLVDPVKSTNINQLSLLHGSIESGSIEESTVRTSFSANHQVETSPLHPISTPEDSFSGVAWIMHSMWIL